MKGIVHIKFVLQGPTAISAYYCDVLRRLRGNVRKLRPEIWRRKNWLFHHDNAPSHTSFFTRELLTKINMTVVPHSLYFPLLPWLKTKLKGRHFDTTEMIEDKRRRCVTPSQKPTSRMNLKNGRSTGNVSYTRKETASWVMVVSRPKISFLTDGSTNPGNYGLLFSNVDPSL
jgi:hypothetical protein